MVNEKFVLMNLADPKSKDLAQVISSDTARKILNLLSEKQYAETDIAKKLKMPLSTVHYNVKALLNSNVIEIKDFLWSEKGKKINIYTLANKLIIIATKEKDQDKFLEKIKEIIPAVIVGFIGTVSLWVYQIINKSPVNGPEKGLQLMQNSEHAVSTLSLETATAMEDHALTSQIMGIQPNYAMWFGLGTLTIILLYVLWLWIGSKK